MNQTNITNTSRNIYSLNSCSKQQCNVCDIGYIIAKYVVPLMQCLTNDIKEYNMQMITTKCLNTAVMFMFFLLGTKGLAHANYCDSRAMFDRHKRGEDNNNVILAKMKQHILRKNSKYRYVYYILMNDSYFPYPDKNKENAFFPGHVFIIEKFPNRQGDPYYHIYQSYINQYDLKGHIKNNHNSLRMTYDDVAGLMDNLTYILNAETWNQHCVEHWYKFTSVKTDNIIGSITKGNLFICCTHSKVKTCVENIETYVQNKLSKLNVSPLSVHANTFGNKELYHQSRERPLSNAEMYDQLSSLLRDIEQNKKNFVSVN